MKKIALIAVLFAALMPSVAFSDAMSFRYLDMPGAEGYTNPRGVDGDTVVGYYQIMGASHGFNYSLGGDTWTTIDMQGASDTKIYGIYGNQIVGTYIADRVCGFVSDTTGSFWRSFRPTSDKQIHLYAIGGNAAGDQTIVAGVVNNSPGGAYQSAFFTNLTTNQSNNINIPALRIEPRGISSGKMVGILYNGDGLNSFIYDTANGSYSFISAPGAANEHTTNLRGISGDTIIGDYVDSLGEGAIRHGFAYNLVTDVWTLVDVVKDGVTVKSTIPYGISNDLIVGTYDDPMGFAVEIPEPATMSLLAVGFLAILKRRRV